MEVWKDIIGYEGKYQISNYGRVKSLERLVWNRFQYVIKKERILKKRYNAKGYVTVLLYLNNKSCSYSVHRLVARHFIANPELKEQVNHINGCKDDNRASNLEWVTGSENQKHAFQLGLYDRRIKEQKVKFSKPVVMMNLDGEELFAFASITCANRYFGQSDSHISDVCKKRRKYALGYCWKYITKEEYHRLRKKYSDQHFQKRDLSRTLIDVYNKEGRYICTFPTLAETAKFLHVSRHKIQKQCLQNGKMMNGYFLQYHDLSRKKIYEKWKNNVNK